MNSAKTIEDIFEAIKAWVAERQDPKAGWNYSDAQVVDVLGAHVRVALREAGIAIDAIYPQ